MKQQRGYYILLTIQIVLILLVILISRQAYLRIPALHGSPVKIVITIAFMALSVLFFIKPFKPEQRIYAFMALFMNVLVLLYLWYAWLIDVNFAR
jgi:hypothetical protein